MSKRRNSRELALKILYQVEVGRLPVDEALATSFEEVVPGGEDRGYVEELVRGVAGQTDALDAIIGDLAEGWRLERLAKVDKTVLRIALYELSHRPEMAANSIINDAVEVAKKYSTEDSGRFVNGILGSFLRRRAESAPSGDQSGDHRGKS